MTFLQAFSYTIDLNDGLTTDIVTDIIEDREDTESAFGGLLFVGRSRYNDIAPTCVLQNVLATLIYSFIVRSQLMKLLVEFTVLLCDLPVLNGVERNWNLFDALAQVWWAFLMVGLAMEP